MWRREHLISFIFSDIFTFKQRERGGESLKIEMYFIAHLKKRNCRTELNMLRTADMNNARTL